MVIKFDFDKHYISVRLFDLQFWRSLALGFRLTPMEEIYVLDLGPISLPETTFLPRRGPPNGVPSQGDKILIYGKGEFSILLAFDIRNDSLHRATVQANASCILGPDSLTLFIGSLFIVHISKASLLFGRTWAGCICCFFVYNIFRKQNKRQSCMDT